MACIARKSRGARAGACKSGRRRSKFTSAPSAINPPLHQLDATLLIIGRHSSNNHVRARHRHAIRSLRLVHARRALQRSRRALPAIDDNLIAAINADKTSKYVAGKNIRFEGATLLDAKRLMGTLQAPATEFLPARSIEEALSCLWNSRPTLTGAPTRARPSARPSRRFATRPIAAPAGRSARSRR